MKVVLKSKEVVDELPFYLLKKVIYIQDSDVKYITSDTGDCTVFLDGYLITFIINSVGLVDQNSIKIV